MIEALKSENAMGKELHTQNAIVFKASGVSEKDSGSSP